MVGRYPSQQADSLALIELCRQRNRPVVVGGPDPTSSPHIYDRADFRVLGEAEGILNELSLPGMPERDRHVRSP